MRKYLPLLLVVAVVLAVVAWECRYSLASPNGPGQKWLPWLGDRPKNPGAGAAPGRSNPPNLMPNLSAERLN